MSEAYGVKESLEVLDSLKVLAVTASKVMEDGKVSLGDLPVLLGLLKEVGTLKAGAEGVDSIPKEIKDLSAEEAALLLNKVYEVIGAFKAKA